MDRTSPFAPNSMQSYSGHNTPPPMAMTSPMMTNSSWSGNSNSYGHARPGMNMESNSPYPSTTLFVGDIPVICSEENIFELFHEFGQIETIQLKKSDRDPQRAHLGYGFVKFATGESAFRALEAVNGKFFMGRNLRVGWADDKQSGVRVPRIQVKNLDQKKTNQTAQIHVSFSITDPYLRISEFHLRSVFERFGNLIDIAIKKNMFNETLGVQSGYGFVHFLLTEEGIHSATRAVEEVNNQIIDNIKYQCKITHSLQVHIFALRRGGGGVGGVGGDLRSGNSLPIAASHPQYQSRSEYQRTTYPPGVPQDRFTTKNYDFPVGNDYSSNAHYHSFNAHLVPPASYGMSREFSEFRDPLTSFRAPVENQRTIPLSNPLESSPPISDQSNVNNLYGFPVYSSTSSFPGDESLVASTAALSLSPPVSSLSMATVATTSREPNYSSYVEEIVNSTTSAVSSNPNLIIEPPRSPSKELLPDSYPQNDTD